MKIDTYARADSDKLNMRLETEIAKDLDQHILLETLSKAKDELVKRAVEHYVEKHLAEVIASIPLNAMKNLILIQAAKAIAEKVK